MSDDLLRRAAALMRDDWRDLGGTTAPMMCAVADWLDMAADHVAGRGDPCGSCVQQAVDVARAYVGEQPTEASLLEQGRSLASQRDDLIAAGVDPTQLVVPLAPPDLGEPQ